MDAIAKGKVRMRPRWHFALLSLLSLTGACIVFLTLLYCAGLAVFLLRDSGALFAPSFGARGWLALLRTLPWLLLALILVFAIVLELLVRRFTFVYKRPLLISVVSIIVLVVAGGALVSEASFHRWLMRAAQRGDLPPPVGMLYAHLPPPPDVYRGRIVSFGANSFALLDEGGAGTTSVLVSSQTHLPYGGDFHVGERVVVVGDMASGTVRAFGVREIDEYLDEQPWYGDRDKADQNGQDERPKERDL